MVARSPAANNEGEDVELLSSSSKRRRGMNLGTFQSQIRVNEFRYQAFVTPYFPPESSGHDDEVSNASDDDEVAPPDAGCDLPSGSSAYRHQIYQRFSSHPGVTESLSRSISDVQHPCIVLKEQRNRPRLAYSSSLFDEHRSSVATFADVESLFITKSCPSPHDFSDRTNASCQPSSSLSQVECISTSPQSLKQSSPKERSIEVMSDEHMSNSSQSSIAAASDPSSQGSPTKGTPNHRAKVLSPSFQDESQLPSAATAASKLDLKLLRAEIGKYQNEQLLKYTQQLNAKSIRAGYCDRPKGGLVSGSYEYLSLCEKIKDLKSGLSCLDPFMVDTRIYTEVIAELRSIVKQYNLSHCQKEADPLGIEDCWIYRPLIKYLVSKHIRRLLTSYLVGDAQKDAELKDGAKHRRFPTIEMSVWQRAEMLGKKQQIKEESHRIKFQYINEIPALVTQSACHASNVSREIINEAQINRIYSLDELKKAQRSLTFRMDRVETWLQSLTNLYQLQNGIRAPLRTAEIVLRQGRELAYYCDLTKHIKKIEADISRCYEFQDAVEKIAPDLLESSSSSSPPTLTKKVSVNELSPLLRQSEQLPFNTIEGDLLSAEIKAIVSWQSMVGEAIADRDLDRCEDLIEGSHESIKLNGIEGLKGHIEIAQWIEKFDKLVNTKRSFNLNQLEELLLAIKRVPYLNSRTAAVDTIMKYKDQIILYATKLLNSNLSAVISQIDRIELEHLLQTLDPAIIIIPPKGPIEVKELPTPKELEEFCSEFTTMRLQLNVTKSIDNLRFKYLKWSKKSKRMFESHHGISLYEAECLLKEGQLICEFLDISVPLSQSKADVSQYKDWVVEVDDFLGKMRQQYCEVDLLRSTNYFPIDDLAHASSKQRDEVVHDGQIGYKEGDIPDLKVIEMGVKISDEWRNSQQHRPDFSTLIKLWNFRSCISDEERMRQLKYIKDKADKWRKRAQLVLKNSTSYTLRLRLLFEAKEIPADHELEDQLASCFHYHLWRLNLNRIQLCIHEDDFHQLHDLPTKKKFQHLLNTNASAKDVWDLKVVCQSENQTINGARIGTHAGDDAKQLTAEDKKSLFIQKECVRKPSVKAISKWNELIQTKNEMELMLILNEIAKNWNSLSNDKRTFEEWNNILSELHNEIIYFESIENKINSFLMKGKEIQLTLITLSEELQLETVKQLQLEIQACPILFKVWDKFEILLSQIESADKEAASLLDDDDDDAIDVKQLAILKQFIETFPEKCKFGQLRVMPTSLANFNIIKEKVEQVDEWIEKTNTLLDGSNHWDIDEFDSHLAKAQHIRIPLVLEFKNKVDISKAWMTLMNKMLPHLTISQGEVLTKRSIGIGMALSVFALLTNEVQRAKCLLIELSSLFRNLREESKLTSDFSFCIGSNCEVLFDVLSEGTDRLRDLIRRSDFQFIDFSQEIQIIEKEIGIRDLYTKALFCIIPKSCKVPLHEVQKIRESLEELKTFPSEEQIQKSSEDTMMSIVSITEFEDDELKEIVKELFNPSVVVVNLPINKIPIINLGHDFKNWVYQVLDDMLSKAKEWLFRYHSIGFLLTKDVDYQFQFNWPTTDLRASITTPDSKASDISGSCGQNRKSGKSSKPPNSTRRQFGCPMTTDFLSCRFGIKLISLFTESVCKKFAELLKNQYLKKDHIFLNVKKLKQLRMQMMPNLFSTLLIPPVMTLTNAHPSFPVLKDAWAQRLMILNHVYGAEAADFGKIEFSEIQMPTFTEAIDLFIEADENLNFDLIEKEILQQTITLMLLWLIILPFNCSLYGMGREKWSEVFDFKDGTSGFSNQIIEVNRTMLTLESINQYIEELDLMPFQISIKNDLVQHYLMLLDDSLKIRNILMMKSNANFERPWDMLLLSSPSLDLTLIKDRAFDFQCIKIALLGHSWEKEMLNAIQKLNLPNVSSERLQFDYQWRLPPAHFNCMQKTYTYATQIMTILMDQDIGICHMCGKQQTPDVPQPINNSQIDDHRWLSCDECLRWFHSGCVGISHEVLGSLLTNDQMATWQFACPICLMRRESVSLLETSIVMNSCWIRLWNTDQTNFLNLNLIENLMKESNLFMNSTSTENEFIAHRCALLSLWFFDVVILLLGKELKIKNAFSCGSQQSVNSIMLKDHICPSSDDRNDSFCNEMKGEEDTTLTSLRCVDEQSDACRESTSFDAKDTIITCDPSDKRQTRSNTGALRAKSAKALLLLGARNGNNNTMNNKKRLLKSPRCGGAVVDSSTEQQQVQSSDNVVVVVRKGKGQKGAAAVAVRQRGVIHSSQDAAVKQQEEGSLQNEIMSTFRVLRPGCFEPGSSSSTTTDSIITQLGKNAPKSSKDMMMICFNLNGMEFIQWLQSLKIDDQKQLETHCQHFVANFLSVEVPDGPDDIFYSKLITKKVFWRVTFPKFANTVQLNPTLHFADELETTKISYPSTAKMILSGMMVGITNTPVLNYLMNTFVQISEYNHELTQYCTNMFSSTCPIIRPSCDQKMISKISLHLFGLPRHHISLIPLSRRLSTDVLPRMNSLLFSVVSRFVVPAEMHLIESIKSAETVTKTIISQLQLACPKRTLDVCEIGGPDGNGVPCVKLSYQNLKELRDSALKYLPPSLGHLFELLVDLKEVQSEFDNWYKRLESPPVDRPPTTTLNVIVNFMARYENLWKLWIEQWKAVVVVQNSSICKRPHPSDRSSDCKRLKCSTTTTDDQTSTNYDEEENLLYPPRHNCPLPHVDVFGVFHIKMNVHSKEEEEVVVDDDELEASLHQIKCLFKEASHLQAQMRALLIVSKTTLVELKDYKNCGEGLGKNETVDHHSKTGLRFSDDIEEILMSLGPPNPPKKFKFSSLDKIMKMHLQSRIVVDEYDELFIIYNKIQDILNQIKKASSDISTYKLWSFDDFLRLGRFISSSTCSLEDSEVWFLMIKSKIDGWIDAVRKIIKKGISRSDQRPEMMMQDAELLSSALTLKKDAALFPVNLSKSRLYSDLKKLIKELKRRQTYYHYSSVTVFPQSTAAAHYTDSAAAAAAATSSQMNNNTSMLCDPIDPIKYNNNIYGKTNNNHNHPSTMGLSSPIPFYYPIQNYAHISDQSFQQSLYGLHDQHLNKDSIIQVEEVQETISDISLFDDENHN